MSKRRGRGEGSIYQRKKDGVWCATATVGHTETGKRKRKTIYGPTKASVQEKLVRLQAAGLDGIAIEPKRMLFGAYLDHWLKTKESTIRAKTLIRYEGVVRLHIKPHLGGTALAQLQPSQIQALYARLEQTGASPRTRGHVHAVLHSALKQAVLWQYVARNVCEAVKKPRVPRAPPSVLPIDRVRDFLEFAKQDRLCALWILAVTTGMRLGEMLGLQWSDVDLKTGAINVRRALVDFGNKRELGETKTPKSRRRIDLPGVTVRALRDHRERMLAEGIRNEWVFCDTRGGPLRQNNVRRRHFHKLLEAAKLPHARIHDLRHTAATILLEQGVHPKVVQERLGHSNISMTLDTYSHVVPSMQKAAASKLDELFSSPAEENGCSLATEAMKPTKVAHETNSKVHDIFENFRHAQRDSNSRHSVPKTDALSS